MSTKVLVTQTKTYRFELNPFEERLFENDRLESHVRYLLANDWTGPETDDIQIERLTEEHGN